MSHYYIENKKQLNFKSLYNIIIQLTNINWSSVLKNILFLAPNGSYLNIYQIWW